MTSDRLAYTQAGRMMAVTTPLGDDVLLLTDLRIDERVNALFEIEAAVKSQRDDLAPGDLVGATVDFRLQLKDDGTRWWNGFVTKMHEDGQTTRGMRSYAITVRPRLWLLSQRSDCRIFLSTTTTDVIETLLREHGISDFEFRVTGQLPAHDYSVQWNETDLDYMLRRMQQDSLFYFFTFEKGRHTLIVSDHQSGYDRAPEENVRFARGSAAMDHINSWRRTFAFTPGRRAARDWNFENMRPIDGAETSFAQVPGNADHELYEFPGRFLDSTEGEAAMRARIQATETGFETVEAASTVRCLGAGQMFTPIDIAKPDNVFARQVVTGMCHVASDPTYETGGGLPSYENSFTTIPAETAATPHRFQRRPRINGSQIALIAGPQGEEIFTDQYGRVKVWFPWDRRARKDGSDTCWIRVGQPWAGGGWGYQTIPRVGMEALVSYQEGDPDRPFVTALVPDPTNFVPYSLPDNKTRTVIRTNTYKGDGFNELHFEDMAGQEDIYCHAQKDMNIEVLNDRNKSVDHDQTETIGNDKSISVGASHTESIGSDKTLSVGQSFGRAVGRISSEAVGMDKTTFVGLDQSVFVGRNKKEEIGGSLDFSVTENCGMDVGQVFEINAGRSFAVKVGKARLQIDSSGTITLEAPQTTIVKGADTQLTLKGGPVLYWPDQVKGKLPSPPAECLRKQAQDDAAFIRPQKEQDVA